MMRRLRAQRESGEDTQGLHEDGLYLPTPTVVSRGGCARRALAQITMLCRRPSCRRKQESRAPAPGPRPPDHVRHPERVLAWLQLILKPPGRVGGAVAVLVLLLWARPAVAGPAPTGDERAALEALYDATDGPNWTDSTNWKTAAGDWYGVTTDDAGNVTRLDLPENNLSGTLPAAVGNLINLQVLHLPINDLSGTIPTELENLSNLRGLHLHNNNLSGTIPPQLGNLSNLQVLLLHNNNLSGTIPTQLGNLSNLSYLSLNSNSLSGSIPPQLGNLSNLEQLYLHNNNLSGTIPTELGNLSELQVLWLHDNALSGPLPASFPSGLTKLKQLHIRNTQVTVPTDPEFTAWLESLGQQSSQPPSQGSGGGGGGGGSGTAGGSGGGSSTPSEEPTGHLENPGADSFQSGIGVLSGWVCAAETVTLELNGVAHVAAYGTERLDTQGECGDTDNGFGLLFNWNLLGDGAHEVVAFVDGEEWSRTTVTVTTLGEEFVRDVTGTCTVPDFPSMGETVTLAWQENQQNFVLAEGPAPTGATRTGTAGVGYLENPGPNSFQSGIGVLSGWVCEATEVEIEITPESGEVSRHVAGYGTERLDTQDTCGDTDNGFGLLFNWNLLGDGEHAVVAYVDDVELGRATVRVTTLGAEFLRGAAGECVVEDFPTVGEAVTLEWQQNQQNFVVTEVE